MDFAPAAARATASYEDKGARFVAKADFAPQYASLYFVRLGLLRDAAWRAAKAQWPDLPADRFVACLTDLSNLPAGPAVCVGTLYRDQQLKPSVLARLQGEDVPVMDRYVSAEDWLALEDGTGRIRLSGCRGDLVTGMVVAVRVAHSATSAQLEAFVDPAASPCAPLVPQSPPRFIAFVSGLHLAGAAANAGGLTLLRNFLLCTSTSGDAALAAQVCRVVVAGSAIASEAGDVASMRDADAYLAMLAASVQVDLMPSTLDPSDALLPQRPLHPSFFKSAGQYENFRTVTNPYHCVIGGCEVLGMSGEGATDVAAFSDCSPLEALVRTAQSRCLAPTAPDTLRCSPQKDQEPFVIPEQSPHIVFSGNHDAAEWKVLESGSLALCIPSFAKVPAVVLVNTSDVRDVRPMKFA